MASVQRRLHPCAKVGATRVLRPCEVGAPAAVVLAPGIGAVGAGQGALGGQHPAAIEVRRWAFSGRFGCWVMDGCHRQLRMNCWVAAVGPTGQNLLPNWQ